MKRQDSLRMRTWFVLLWMLVGMLPLYAQNAFHVYRHNGTINTFFYANLDSITYANIVAETGEQTSDFMQEFHTPDSVYRIPVNEIDSISFYAPPTVYKPDVVKLEESLFAYVVRSEGQNFLLKKDIPLMYVPKAGDKLVTLEMTEAFPAGFAGVVTDIEETAEGYWVKCDLPSLTDIFSSYYYEGSIDLVETDTEEDPQSRAPEIWPPIDARFELPTFELTWNVIELGLIPYEHPVSASVSQSLGWTLKSNMRLYTSLFVSEGVHFHITMTGEHELTTDISMSVTGTLTFKNGKEVSTPIPIAPLLSLYFEPGGFFEYSGSYTGGYSQTEYLGSALHYSYDSGSPSNIPSQARIVSKGKSAPIVDFMANVTLKLGVYGEFGVAVVSSEIAKAGLGINAGFKFDCSANLDDTYAISSPPDTYMYEKYKGEELYSLSAFCGAGLELKALNAKSSYGGEVSVGLPFLTCNLYPDFENVTAEMVKDSIGQLKVEADVTGNCLKKDVGFALYQDDQLLEKIYYHTPFDGKTPLAMSHVFKGLEPGKSYTVYPITKVVGSMELLATPSADAELEVDVTTGNYDGLTSSSVKLYGKVEGVDKNTDCKYGIAYKEKGDEQWTEKEATLQENNTFSCDVTGLSPDTEYDYQAYLRMDDETYYGEIHSFKTEAKEEDENENGEGGGNGSGGSSGGEISLREALIRLYQSTDGDNWISNRNWCSDRPLNEWYGVYIEEGKGHINLRGNNLKGVIDVSGCTSLKVLECYYNQLTSLNVSGCTSLESLDCDDNQLTSLNVSGCTSLKVLDCYDNQLTSLNVSGCTSLESLDCDNNPLERLIVSGCTALRSLDNNRASGWTGKLYLDASGCTSLESLICYGCQAVSMDFSGCTSLKVLECYRNQLTSLNVSGCTSLKVLECYDNQLTSLNVSGCTSLESLDCDNNPLERLNVSGCTALRSLDNNWVSDWTGRLYLDASGCTSLESLNCPGNQIISLNVSGCTSLKVLECYDNQLTSLNVSGCTSLVELYCSDNQLTSLNVSGCTSLVELYCDENQLTSLNVSGCTSLRILECYTNQLTSLNVSGYTSLESLDCDDNPLESLIVSGCTALRSLDNNNIALGWTGKLYLDASGCTSLESLICYGCQAVSMDFSGCTSLVELYCYENQLTSLNVSGCTSLVKLSCGENQLTSLNVSGCTSLESLNCANNQLTSLNVSGCTSLKYLRCSDNKISSVISSWYSQLKSFYYDQRYTYYWVGEELKYNDKGYGWWYPGEPGKGYHGPN